ncbi:carboxylating nicotinate-nucleotide diphosphorylase [Marinihelvus fidelis]|uniref:Probable nicotinate-nucleotide pyrophosphorylase [carboxylating] n=1 Tax=Marinihelvus fidelis TaxID=2613842 RepID=A0A5N0TCN2_9GAMM|nr:carboxylating nicotinate-nucleotide diphosphorylase [Marinihelvus fidelis]KAA9132511.1 carboxylating nicotinate-nucleotide diphosphorylase [Marinihelvus fidelis]
MTGPTVPGCVDDDVLRALAEDIGDGDLTAALVPTGTRLRTRVIIREPAVLAGRPWFDAVFRHLDGDVAIDWRVDDGDALSPDQVLCELDGDARTLLSGERTALNFIQTLSSAATLTRAYVERVAGTGAVILDTRKTVPGLRLAQKYAVRCGGGQNHRIGLFDAILVKENHISAAGSITAAVERARATTRDVLVEVEVETLAQLDEACRGGADRALLDNFGLDNLSAAVAAHGGDIQLEASGNITLDSIREVAETGVDFISTGAITKHVRAIDFSMRYIGETP